MAMCLRFGVHSDVCRPIKPPQIYVFAFKHKGSRPIKPPQIYVCRGQIYVFAFKHKGSRPTKLPQIYVCRGGQLLQIYVYYNPQHTWCAHVCDSGPNESKACLLTHKCVIKTYIAILLSWCPIHSTYTVPAWLLSSGTTGSFINSSSYCLNSSSLQYRSEERRVGKECRSRWSPYH